MFESIPFEERIVAAKDCGVDAIEFWDAKKKDRHAIARTCEHTGIHIAAISVCDSWLVRLNDCRSKVLENFEETIRFGQDLGCSHFIGLAGDDETGGLQTSVMVDNLRCVAEIAEKHGVVVLVEALNSIYDHKGYSLTSSFEGINIVEQVNSPGVKFLYDIYHMQIMEGNLINNIQTHMDYIGHFHFAGVPGRHEPYLGEINYAAVVRAIEGKNFTGYCGLEYWPSIDSKKSVCKTIDYLRKALG